MPFGTQTLVKRALCGGALATVLVVACANPAKTPAGGEAADAALPPGAECYPVVAVGCGCVYGCVMGVLEKDGRYAIHSPRWGKEPAVYYGRLAPYCAEGQCASVFRADVPCDGVCSPRPADPTCHLDGNRCVSAGASTPDGGP